MVQHELKRWAKDGPQLSNIDAVVYLSERHATVQGSLLVLPIVLIEQGNPTWQDLAEDFGFEPLVGPGSGPG